MSKTVIHWFRQDLRLSDNPALYEAAAAGKVIPVYILDDENAGRYGMGGAARWWLHHSLVSLGKSLGGNLRVYRGNPETILQVLVRKYAVEAVYWNRCYEYWQIERDTQIKKRLKADEVEVFSFNGSLLWEPWEVLKQDGTPYRVFTPFYRRGCLNALPPRKPLPVPRDLTLLEDKSERAETDDLELLPRVRWDKQLEPHWIIGEAGAAVRLDGFLKNGLSGYREGRNYPSRDNVSRLSPHLHFGEISPNQVWHGVRGRGDGNDVDHFCSELGWREFSYNLLYYNPEMPEKNLQVKFNSFPWRKSKRFLRRWQKGQTGYPIVDAGMRELWQTGYMHNRVRMIVGSFLVKNLLLHWREGEKWFRDCLVDADLANNSSGWQWIAGCGADAAPYFRIFNPVTQGLKFDPEGEYIRRFVPELVDLPLKYLFAPFSAPVDVLKQAGIVLGRDYPLPVVDIKLSREQALEAFRSL